jgi:hypothetical protein
MEGAAMSKHELKADEYRARAKDASAAADSATLARVRERHEQAARTWSDLADAVEARTLTRRVPDPAAPVASESPAE